MAKTCSDYDLWHFLKPINTLLQKIYTFHGKILCISYSMCKNGKLQSYWKRYLLLLVFVHFIKILVATLRRQKHIKTYWKKIECVFVLFIIIHFKKCGKIIFWQKITPYPNALLKPKSCSTWFFSETYSEGGNFLRIIDIALFFVFLPIISRNL